MFFRRGEQRLKVDETRTISATLLLQPIIERPYTFSYPQARYLAPGAIVKLNAPFLFGTGQRYGDIIEVLDASERTLLGELARSARPHSPWLYHLDFDREARVERTEGLDGTRVDAYAYLSVLVRRRV